MSVTIANLRADCGEVYDNLTNGTTAATSLLSKAQDLIAKITGTTTGYDLAVRNLADAYVCQQGLGATSSTSQSVSVISVGRKEVVAMRDRFIVDCTNALALDGFTLQPGNILFEVVNK